MINFIKIALLISMVINCSTHTMESAKGSVLTTRPPEIQQAVDKAFEKIKTETQWHHNGSNWYGLLAIDDELMLKHLASDNHEQKEVYMIDVGCGAGNWGRHAMTILQSEVCKNSSKKFHIFSITGGKECEEVIQHQDHVTLYQLNQFKIENIDQELSQRGFELKGKVDLIVSKWTLRHLVDPFGTLKRMYTLLTPQKGMLLSNGFLFKFNDSDEVLAFPRGNENILNQANATSIFRYYTNLRDVNQFLLRRNNNKELEIPLEYTGNLHAIGGRFQCASETVTVFKKGALAPFDRDCIKDSSNLYYNKGDQECKNLHNILKHHALFAKSLIG